MCRRRVPRACLLTQAAHQVPAEYTPVDYTTKALQQTRVTLTWDADDPERKKQLRRKLTSEQLRDEDFAAYLGSGSEDEQDEDEKQVRTTTRCLDTHAREADPRIVSLRDSRPRLGFAAPCLATPPQQLAAAASALQTLALTRMAPPPGRALHDEHRVMTT